MANEPKPAGRNKPKSIDERFQNRLNDLYSSGENLPASINIRQAEKLMARVQELEEKLAGGVSASAQDSPTPVPALETFSAPSAQAEPPRKALPQIASLPRVSLPVRFPRLARLWDRLTGAAPGIQKTGERQQSQLTAAIALGLGVLTFIGLIAGAASNGFTNNSIVLLILTVFVFLTYGITRSRYYKWGAAALVLMFVAGGFGLALSNPGRESIEFFTMLPIALILGSLLLPMWGLAVLTGVNFLSVILFPTIASTYLASDATTNAGILLTLGILLIIAVAFRNAVERLRVTEVTTANKELQAMQVSLEQRVEDRTYDLELAAEVGRTITEKVADLQEMLTSSVEMIRARFNLYYTQVYLTDAAGKNLNLKSGTGSVGQELLKRSHHLSVSSSSLNGRAATDKKAVIVADTTLSPTFLPNPLLQKTRSEMAIPLIAGGQVIGVLDMQSETPGALNESNLPAFETLAGQLSVAIQNAGLFAQTREARQQIEASVRRSTRDGWQDFLNSIDRSERIGYLFDQNETVPMQNFEQAKPQSCLSVPISITGVQVGNIQSVEEGRAWSSQDAELVEATASRLGQHIEDLRLLAQAEHYRSEAEQATRQLTRQGWESYLTTRKEIASGFMYDRNEVRTLDGNGKGISQSAIKQALVVRAESIGELEVEVDTRSGATAELIAAVADQLSSKIENLRLFDATQQELGERKRAEESLIKFRQGMQRSSDAMFMTDTQGMIIYTNPAFEKIYGFTQQEALGKTPRILKSGVLPQETYKNFWSTLLSKEIVAGEIINKTRDGRLIPIEGANTPILDEAGSLIGFLAIHRDVSERKQAQEALARRAQEMETVAEMSTTTSTVLDPDRLLQTIVDLTRERFNVYHAHIYLADESWQTLLLAAGAGEVGRKMVAQEHAIAMDTEKSLVARASRERHAVIVNDVRGEPGFLPNPDLPETRSEMAVPMIVGDKVLGVFDVQSNVVNGFSSEDASIYTTLASQVAVALQNARLYAEQASTVTQLRELDRLKSSFLANMSHELRTPLNSILGFSDVMLDELDGPLTENMNNDLLLIQKNGQHLLHLINDVLDMAKIEAGRMNLSPEEFVLQEVLDEVVSITSPMASEKELAFSFERDSDHKVQIIADRTRMRQIMINLVNNAIKYTEVGKITIRTTPQDEKRVLIAVKDTGIGIPPDKLETIFQEFAQIDTSSTRKGGGTGLGLPISRRLVEMHGGRLWAESTGVAGEGSTFYVEMPLEARIIEPIELMEK